MKKFIYFCCLLALVGCGDSKKDERVPPIIVITSPDNPPFEFKDTSKGGDKVIGFDIDVVHKLGEKLGRKIKIIESEFSAIIPALQSGRADMAVAGLTATDERRKSVDLSDTYYADKIALLVSEESAIASEKDLSGQELGVQLGTSHEAMAKKWRSIDANIQLVSLNKTGDLIQELKNGRIDAVLIGLSEAKKIAASTIGIKAVPLEVQGEAFVIAFPKGSPLVKPTNEALGTMSDDIKNLEQKWMNK
jgi:ABC-type amino acid transport substrate-binding protein